MKIMINDPNEDSDIFACQMQAEDALKSHGYDPQQIDYTVKEK